MYILVEEREGNPYIYIYIAADLIGNAGRLDFLSTIGFH
jgi:hypothetical protein